ncbi:MAG: SsrA-binding protein SmpB [Metamycoplasmataceae bacterium]
MSKIISKNKIAKFDYEIVEKYVCGIVLSGWEVKSIRASNVNLRNSFCSFLKNELFVSNMHISKYMLVEGDETRARKLLLKKSELNKILTKQQKYKYSIIPLTLLWENGNVKLEIGLGKGRNKADKRSYIIERDEKKRLKSIL